jgi:CheY-like chemotaxis protein
MSDLRICLAEDNPDALRAMTTLLELLGHQVVCTARNGQELVQRAVDCRPDVVLLDLDMPLMDGLEAADEVFRRLGAPVIMISGHPDAEHVVVEKEPIVEVLYKPVDPDPLQQALRRAVERRPPRDPSSEAD